MKTIIAGKILVHKAVVFKMVPDKHRGGLNNGCMSGRQRLKPGGPKGVNTRNMGTIYNAIQLSDNQDFNCRGNIPVSWNGRARATIPATNTSATENVKNGAGMRREWKWEFFWCPPMPPMAPMCPMGGGPMGNGPFPPPPPYFRVSDGYAKYAWWPDDADFASERPIRRSAFRSR
ncbi:uncharacterized protein LOC134291842 isoform X1 [Aedes albopictus]|uniref:Secreted protein n=1 Tax=Aedes albopictus TaxID=7160 RepID=A0ABM1Z7M2_AEDAL